MSISSSTGFNVERQSTIATVGDTTFYVDDDFNESTPGWNVTHFDKIKNAINVVNNGDTVYVFNGTYYENFKITKSINLIGEDKNSTIIDARQKAYVMNFKANYINVSGFTIQNTRNWVDDCGILIWDKRKYNTICDNIFTNHRTNAILIFKSDYNIISENIFMENKRGNIELRYLSDYNVISKNKFIGGINYFNRRNLNNSMVDNHLTNVITYIDEGSNYSISGNIFIGGKIQLFDETVNNFINNNKFYSSAEISIYDSEQNIIQDNTFVNSTGGIIFYEDNINYWIGQTIKNNIINGKAIYYLKRKIGVRIPSNAGQLYLYAAISVV